MHSVCINDKVLDFKYSKLNGWCWNFYIGDIFLGQIFNVNKSYTAVPFFKQSICKVYGFKLRYYA